MLVLLPFATTVTLMPARVGKVAPFTRALDGTKKGMTCRARVAATAALSLWKATALLPRLVSRFWKDCSSAKQHRKVRELLDAETM
jgi:hypothetical protein